MKNVVVGTLSTIGAIVIAGCASTGANLQRETARSIGGNLSEGQVTVSDVDRSATSVKWNAATPNGRYECSADDMVRRVLCVRALGTASVAPSERTQVRAEPPQRAETSSQQSAAAQSKPPELASRPSDQPASMSNIEAQRKLIELKFLKGKADGKFGKSSVEALRKYQQANGLPVSGALDDDTVRKLRGGQASGGAPTQAERTPAPTQVAAAPAEATSKEPPGTARVCERNFIVGGSLFSGYSYKTWQEHSGVSYDTAFRKVAQAVATNGWGTATPNKDAGIITASQTVTFGKGSTAPLNVVVQEKNSRTVRVEVNFNTGPGQKASEDTARAELCKLAESPSK